MKADAGVGLDVCEDDPTMRMNQQEAVRARSIQARRASR
jgi:hypothetical protein